MTTIIPQSELDDLEAALADLRRTRAHLEEEIATIDAKILELFASFVAHHGSSTSTALIAGSATSATTKFLSKPGISSVKEIQNAARNTIEEHGSPMHREELYDALYAQGIRVGGKDAMRNFSSHLSHDKRLMSINDVKKGFWSLRKWGPHHDGNPISGFSLGNATKSGFPRQGAVNA